MKICLRLNSGIVMCLTLLFGFAVNVEAGIIQSINGYDVSYEMVIDVPTDTGNDIENVVIFEWTSNDYNADYPFTIAGFGRTDLTHTIEFAPTHSLVLGVLDAVPNVGDGKRHLYMLASEAFSQHVFQNLVGQKFSQIFGVGEQFTINLLFAAVLNDQTAVNDLEALVTNNFSAAAFNPEDGFKILKWSIAPTDPSGGNIPEPSTIALLSLVIAGSVFRKKEL